MYYEHIQQALDKVACTLSKEELEELLQKKTKVICVQNLDLNFQIGLKTH